LFQLIDKAAYIWLVFLCNILHAFYRSSDNAFSAKILHPELFQIIQELSGKEIMEFLQKEIAKIQPAVITNMVENPTDKNAGHIVKLVAEKYLMIHPVDLGGVAYDRRIYKMVSEMVPLTELEQSNEALASAYEIVMKLL